MTNAMEVLIEALDDTQWEEIFADRADSILAALNDAGYAIVPKKPNAVMWQAAADCYTANNNSLNPNMVWSAMLAAGETK